MTYDARADNAYHEWLKARNNPDDPHTLETFRAGWGMRTKAADGALKGMPWLTEVGIISQELKRLEDEVHHTLRTSVSQEISKWAYYAENVRLRDLLKERGIVEADIPAYARIMMQRRELKQLNSLVGQLKARIQELEGEAL